MVGVAARRGAGRRCCGRCVRAILRSPDILWLYLRTRRGVRGYLAVSQGLIAIGSGDARAARKFADEAQPHRAGRAAHAAAQRAGRRSSPATARPRSAPSTPWPAATTPGCSACTACSSRRSGATTRVAARLYAEEAAQERARAPAWAGQAVFDARCAAGDWTGALERLDRNMKSGPARPRGLSAPARRAAHRARAGGRGARPRRRPRARARSGEARADAGAGGGARRPAARRGRRPAPRGAHRRGGLEGQSASRSRRHLCASAARRFRARPARARRDAGREDARAISKARWRWRAPRSTRRNSPSRARALAPLSIAPTQRVAMLMAELEETEHGDEGRAREWMTRAVHARRDPAWTADGFVSDRWMPVSPVTGRLDAFQWKDPLAEARRRRRGDRGTTGARAPCPARRAAARRRAARARQPPHAARGRDEEAPAAAAPVAANRLSPGGARTPRPRRRPPRFRRAGVSRWCMCPTIPGPDAPSRRRAGDRAAAGTAERGWRKLRRAVQVSSPREP